MDHKIHRVVNFQIVGEYILKVTFEDGTQQTIDFSPLLYGEFLAPLKDINVFNQVKIDPEVHTLVWPTGADFDPETLYNWPRYSEAFIRRIQQLHSQIN